MRATTALAVGAALALLACGPPREGPGEIAWGRDACEHCRMAVSERDDAVQLRSARDHRLHVFDDLGCALLWQDERGADEAEAQELWVADPSGGWRDGLSARYTDGHRTPMNHGFRAAPPGSEGLDLAQVRARVIERERERRSRRR